VFHGLKTLEYDLALYETNRTIMLKALEDIHPTISKALEKLVQRTNGNKEKARVLFSGMFERKTGKTKVQKGRFAQALAQAIYESNDKFIVPDHIVSAIKHVCDA